ncbi:ribosomal maturation YjgA family protein [Coleofasciculus sp. F4-SAH-05]|uniref:ribosomal maturation YjgA family protein n=1 Tax=Coleofasciculus sp. F4-SAH-05 TaxID=3069525 RepID=UPI0032F34D52
MKYRIILLISIILIAPLGYGVRFYLPAPEWLNDRLGSFAYEIFWILLVGLFFPKASPLWTAVGVFLVTCLLEVLQLWQPPFLQAIRATLLGRVILGNTFTWSDFPAYFIGSFLGWVWMRSAWLYSRQSHRHSKS